MIRAGLALVLLATAAPALAQPRGMAEADADHDGRLNLSEYRVLSAAALMAFDTDHDGRVTRAELPMMAKMPGARGRVERMFKVWDASGDGIITREELQARGASRFSELDTDRNGFLSAAEVEAGRAGSR